MKTKTIKKVSFSILALAILGTALLTIFISKDRKKITYANTQTAVASEIIKDSESDNDLIKIGLIGDSWVAGEKLDKYIEAQLNSSNIKSDIVSFGHPGANSKAIYGNLTSSSSNIYSSNSLLTNTDVNTIVVIAGVNDTAGHMGSDFYTHHMLEIIRTINQHGKIPLILEVPEYGIEEPEVFRSSLKHNLYKVLFDKNNTNVIEEYRDALKNELDSSKLKYKIIPFDPVIKDYHNQISLYKDQFHLNEEGNNLLGSYIGEYIIDNQIN